MEVEEDIINKKTFVLSNVRKIDKGIIETMD